MSSSHCSNLATPGGVEISDSFETYDGVLSRVENLYSVCSLYTYDDASMPKHNEAQESNSATSNTKLNEWITQCSDTQACSRKKDCEGRLLNNWGMAQRPEIPGLICLQSKMCVLCWWKHSFHFILHWNTMSHLRIYTSCDTRAPVSGTSILNDVEPVLRLLKTWQHIQHRPEIKALAPCIRQAKIGDSGSLFPFMDTSKLEWTRSNGDSNLACIQFNTVTR